jgi:DNA-binding transcriptional regulator YhcF (GntR family)
MFVAPGARKTLIAKRREAFATNFVEPLLREAGRLDIDSEEVIVMIKKGTDAL